MSDGPTPNSWETAAPQLLWGVFAFAFGFEGVVMLFEGHFLLAGAGAAGALILTGIAIKWKRIAAWSPNLSKTTALVATDGRFWVVVLCALLALLAFSGFVQQELFSAYSKIRSETGRIAWNFDQTASGAGYFLNMTRTGNQEIRVYGFQAHGKNNSSDPVTQFSGYIRSDLTNVQRPILLLGQDVDDSKVAACVPRVPTLPHETFGIPGFADFDIVTFEKTFMDVSTDGMTLTQFLNTFVPFTVIVNYDGKQFERKFSREEVIRQAETFERSASLQSIPRVLRTPNAKVPSLPPLQSLLPRDVSAPQNATPIPKRPATEESKEPVGVITPNGQQNGSSN